MQRDHFIVPCNTPREALSLSPGTNTQIPFYCTLGHTQINPFIVPWTTYADRPFYCPLTHTQRDPFIVTCDTHTDTLLLSPRTHPEIPFYWPQDHTRRDTLLLSTGPHTQRDPFIVPWDTPIYRPFYRLLEHTQRDPNREPFALDWITSVQLLHNKQIEEAGC